MRLVKRPGGVADLDLEAAVAERGEQHVAARGSERGQGLSMRSRNSNTSSQVVTRSRKGIRGGQAVEQRHLFEQTQIATVALDGSAALSGGGRAEAA